MASTMFMRVDEVAEELGVSVPYAYKLIRSMNAELKKTGCISMLIIARQQAAGQAPPARRQMSICPARLITA